jgi:uncharacterized protein
VHTEDFFFVANGQRLAATRITAADGPEPGILGLHGLGPTATRHRLRYLLDPLAAHGYGAVTFDFSGNGDSTGVLAESSLRGRLRETRAAAAHVGQAPVVIGTSMGAHLAAATVAELRPRGLVLFCPAAYPADAADQRFDGSLARPGNHADSPAFAGIREFDGDLLIVAAGRDQVVDPSTIDGYLTGASHARSTEVLWLAECDHFVHRWLPGQDAHKADVLAAILRILSADRHSRQKEATTHVR